MTDYSLQTPERVRADLARRMRELRLARGWRQLTLAERSGVSLGSLRRFEASGQVSLQNLLKLAFALGRLDDFSGLFEAPVSSTMAELEAMQTRPARKRGTI